MKTFLFVITGGVGWSGGGEMLPAQWAGAKDAVKYPPTPRPAHN